MIRNLVMALMSLLLVSCGSEVCIFGLGKCDWSSVSGNLKITPSSSSVAVTKAVTLTAEGGTAPYTWLGLTGGSTNVDANDSSKATFTAGATAGYGCARVTDSANTTADLCITITAT